MGSEKLPTGVEIRRERVYVWFRWKGERFYEAVGKAQPTTISRAAKLRAEIVGLIKTGIFDEEMYLQYFPNSKRVEPEFRNYRFFDLCQKWLDSLEVADNTRADYRKSLTRCWLPHFVDHDIRKIRLSDIKVAIKANNYKTPRTRNNTLVPLRGVFKMALLDKLIMENPMIHIDNVFDKTARPDPLSIAERDLVLQFIKENEHPVFYHYFVVSFASGCRQPSEVSALHWDSVDFNKRAIFIQRRIVDGKLVDGTKTKKTRYVRLSQDGIDSLKAMRSITGFDGDFVFKSPQGNPFLSPNRNLNKVWTRALKGCGIRHHEMRQTRHTAASNWIMAGMNLKFVADQLGDRVDTVMRHYADWIDEQGTDDELQKLDAFENKIAYKLRTKEK